MACSLVEVKTKIEGTTLFAEGGCIKDTGIYVPPVHNDSSTKLTAILWLHGWYVNDDRNLLSPSAGYATLLRESVLASKKDVVLLAPFLGHKWKEQEVKDGQPVFKDGKPVMVVRGSLGLGSLGIKEGCDKYLTQIEEELSEHYKIKGVKIEKLIIACHSGGGELMRDATGTLGGHLPALAECWGFDCMYNTGEVYGRWADNLPAVYFFFYLADGSHGDFFAQFWQFAFGTTGHPEPQPMHNVYLAPALPGMAAVPDQIAFQSVDTIVQKTAKLTPFEEFRKRVDQYLDSPLKYHSEVMKSVESHFSVVKDMLRPRIEGLFAPKPPGALAGKSLRPPASPLPAKPVKKRSK